MSDLETLMAMCEACEQPGVLTATSNAYAVAYGATQRLDVKLPHSQNTVVFFFDRGGDLVRIGTHDD